MELHDLKAWDRNPRDITDDRTKQLALSMGEFGDISGIVYNEHPDVQALVSGHQRMAVLRGKHGDALKLVDGAVTEPSGKSWPVRVVSWEPAKHTAANVVANASHIGGTWTDEINELVDDIETDLGDLADDLDLQLLKMDIEVIPPEGNTDPDAVPDPPADPITTPGDLWVLGDHRLLCGDSTNAQHVELVMRGEVADICITDPPYGVDYEGITNDDAAGLPELLQGSLALVDAYLKPGGCYYIFHPDIHAYEFIQAVRDLGWVQARPAMMVWVKDRLVMGMGDYHTQAEFILYGWKSGEGHHKVTDRSQSNVWEFPRPAASEGHPTMKPVALIERAIGNSSTTREIAYEPFSGSGTTILACERMKRRCRAVELEPRYCDVAVKRWEDHTGKDAVLEENGKTWAELSEA